MIAVFRLKILLISSFALIGSRCSRKTIDSWHCKNQALEQILETHKKEQWNLLIRHYKSAALQVEVSVQSNPSNYFW